MATARLEKLQHAFDLRTAGQLDAAEAACSAILDEDPNCVAMLILRGLIAHERSDSAQAKQWLERALVAAPRDPRAHQQYGNICAATGDFERAITHYREGIRLAPYDTPLYRNLAELTSLSLNDPIVKQLQQLLQQRGQVDNPLSDQHYSDLYFAAGKIHNDQQDYDQAFEYYTLANQIRTGQFDQAKNTAQINKIIRDYPADFFTQHKKSGNRSQKPIFIVGMPRSGSTLIEQILLAHPSVESIGENDHLGQLISQALETTMEINISAAGSKIIKQEKPELNKETIKQLADDYLAYSEKLAPHGKRIANKMLFNFKYLGAIAVMFPRAQIIHCQRHPIEVCLSCYFQNFASGQYYSFDLSDIADYYVDYYRLIAHWREVLPIDILEVPYENLVTDPEPMMRKITAFCHLRWSKRCLEFYNNEHQVATSSLWQVRQPLYSTSINNRRHYEKHLTILYEKLADIL